MVYNIKKCPFIFVIFIFSIYVILAAAEINQGAGGQNMPLNQQVAIEQEVASFQPHQAGAGNFYLLFF